MSAAEALLFAPRAWIDGRWVDDVQLRIGSDGCWADDGDDE
jgi:hypothetical protein